MKNLIIPLLILLVVFASCQKDENKPKNQPDVNPALKSAVVEQNNSFSLDIFKQLVANDPAETNVFISPLSMYYALGMAGVGSDGTTLDEFRNLLGWDETNDTLVLKAMQQIYSDISPESNTITFEIANSLWQKQNYPIYESYKSKIATYFDGEVRELDFADPGSVDVINGWIENKTHDKIQDMLDDIQADAVLYLINAIYFKGDWKYIFKEEDTEDKPFYLANSQSVQVPFMSQKAKVAYLKNSQFSMISLPYADTSYSMLILLPDNSSGIDGLLNQLTIENWQNWQDQVVFDSVNICIPKFKFVYGTRLINGELKNLGLQQAFTDGADFSKITPNNVSISRVLHKAFIEVNEKGSEAAAATIVEMWETSAPVNEEKWFRADRPFIFVICHQPTKTILFVGKMADPQ
jgi:serpin B